MAEDSALDMAANEALNYIIVSQNAIFLAIYLFVSRKSITFAADNHK